jgi:hypothetical protein
MAIPTEPVGSLPRPAKLRAALAAYDAGRTSRDELLREQDAACLDSITQMRRRPNRLGEAWPCLSSGGVTRVRRPPPTMATSCRPRPG